MDPLTYAVHLDGVLVTRDMLAGAEETAELANRLRAGKGEFPDPESATNLAAALKGALPAELVTIVLWHDA